MRCECGVNFSRFSAPLVGSYGESCVAEKTKRRRDEETKGLRVKKTKRQKDKERKRGRGKETKGLRVKETKGQRVKETKGRRVKETKSQRDKGSKRRREEETKGREDENRVISYSCPLHSPIRSILIQFVSKNIREMRVSKQHAKEHRFVRGR